MILSWLNLLRLLLVLPILVVYLLLLHVARFDLVQDGWLAAIVRAVITAAAASLCGTTDVV